jgi:hypothetical protein
MKKRMLRSVLAAAVVAVALAFGVASPLGGVADSKQGDVGWNLQAESQDVGWNIQAAGASTQDVGW